MRGDDGKVHCLDRLTTDVLDKFGQLFDLFLKFLTYVAIVLVWMGTLAHLYNAMAPEGDGTADEPPYDGTLSPTKDEDAQAPRTDPLAWDYQVFSVITDVGYIGLTCVLFLAHMEIEKFLEWVPVFSHWIARTTLQLFVGVQTVNAATSLHVSGNQRTGVTELGSAAGWLMVSVGMFNLFFNTLFSFSNRPCRLCGFCCIVGFAVCVPIFAVVGTTT
eukprot:TRINITY_DN9943_c0_g1_i1.p1 TRINITY_DN9943_c0_g1~~TRINITY_DN9943_c0_g1_i1.p1  ORF type:complete len:217 (+),score=64.15 TRINITY_DN9943_c0_g1_i1:88-738(+)